MTTQKKRHYKNSTRKNKENWGRGNLSALEKFEEKLDDLRAKEVKALLFDEFLRVTNNSKAGNQSLLGFFGKK